MNREIFYESLLLLLISVAVLLAMLAIMLLATGGAAHAHDWYDEGCCGGQDCAPVISSSYVAGAAYDAAGKPIANPLPQMIVTTKLGTAIVPPNLPRRLSRDGQMHACIHAFDGVKRVLCIYVPPGI